MTHEEYDTFRQAIDGELDDALAQSVLENAAIVGATIALTHAVLVLGAVLVDIENRR